MLPVMQRRAQRAAAGPMSAPSRYQLRIPAADMPPSQCYREYLESPKKRKKKKKVNILVIFLGNSIAIDKDWRKRTFMAFILPLMYWFCFAKSSTNSLV
jgi:hypothetical protein